MTDSQFELFMIHGGMMSEGLKSEEALAFIFRGQLGSTEDIFWLMERNAYSRAAAEASAARESLNG